MINTKRLKIYAASKEQMEAFIEAQSVEVLKEAYTEMLDGCLGHSDQWEWYAIWMIELKDGTHIGELCFKGIDEFGSTEIGYGIDKEYEGAGYTTEAVRALINWAFDHEVLFVEAEAAENNAASIHILEKLGFTKYGQGDEGLRFVKEKPGTSYTAVGMSMGMCLGLSIGMLIFDNMNWGMCAGMMLGLSLGAVKDKREKSKMAQLRKDRYGIQMNDDGK